MFILRENFYLISLILSLEKSLNKSNHSYGFEIITYKADEPNAEEIN